MHASMHAVKPKPPKLLGGLMHVLSLPLHCWTPAPRRHPSETVHHLSWLLSIWWSSGYILSPSQMTELLTLALTEALAATTHPWPVVGSVNQLRTMTSNLEVPILIAATWLHPEILSIQFWSQSVKKIKSSEVQHLPGMSTTYYRQWGPMDSNQQFSCSEAAVLKHTFTLNYDSGLISWYNLV